MVSEQLLPLRDTNRLTKDAACELAEKVVGRPVHMGYAAERLGGEKPLGHVARADVTEDGTHVRVLVRLNENDPVAVQAHALLETRECGLGLDATVKTKPGELPDMRATAHVVSVIGVAALNVVPSAADTARLGQLRES